MDNVFRKSTYLSPKYMKKDASTAYCVFNNVVGLMTPSSEHHCHSFQILR